MMTFVPRGTDPAANWDALLARQEAETMGEPEPLVDEGAWKREALDRLAKGGTVVLPPPRRRRHYGRSILGLIGILVFVLGVGAVLYGVGL